MKFLFTAETQRLLFFSGFLPAFRVIARRASKVNGEAIPFVVILSPAACRTIRRISKLLAQILHLPHLMVFSG